MARHAFHGAAGRFDVTAAFIAERIPAATFVADVAGGQGMLSRLLAKRYNIHSEVIDPRGWPLTGVANRQIAYTADMADFYDLITRPGAPPGRRVGRSGTGCPRAVLQLLDGTEPGSAVTALLTAISSHHAAIGGHVEPVTLAFDGPMNRGLILRPPES